MEEAATWADDQVLAHRSGGYAVHSFRKEGGSEETGSNVRNFFFILVILEPFLRSS